MRMNIDAPSAMSAAHEVQAETLTTSAQRRIAGLTVIGFAVYCLVVLAVKWLGFSSAVFDHAKEIYHAQELRWVYDAANPPLYTWLLYGLQQLIGVRLSTVLILNSLLLFLIFLSSFALARRVLVSPFQAALAAWSLMLVGQYHKFLYTMSHSLLAAIFCPLLLWLMLRIAAERRLVDYIAAGLVIGLGLLSKFLFLAAAVAALIAVLGLRRTRPGVLNPGFALTIGIAAAVFVPFVVASQDHWSRLTAVVRSRTGANLPGSYLSGLGDGIWSLSSSVGQYVLALVLAAVVAVLWAARSRGRPSADTPRQAAHPDDVRFLGHMMLTGLALILLAVVAADVSIVKPRFVHIFLFPLPILAVALVARGHAGEAALRRYAVLLAVIGAGILAVRVVNTTPVCLNRCDDLVPFDRLAAQLKAAGFRHGTILAFGVRLGGNMVLQLPASRVDVAVDPFVPKPAPAGRRGQCLVVWEEGDIPAGQVPPALIAAAGLPPDRAHAATRDVEIEWRWYGLPVLEAFGDWRPRRTTWHYILLPGGTAACR